MTALSLDDLRQRIRSRILVDDEHALVAELVEDAALDHAARQAIAKDAESLVEQVRSAANPGMLESFLAEYTLSTTEGIALMCLAEALLRVPDNQTIDDLIEDKITPSGWAEHMGRAASPMVNMSTLALTLTGEVLRDSEGIAGALKSIIQRIGEPVIRSAVLQAMKILGGQFVLGRTIDEATRIARKQEKDGYTYSYDMLGEAARTAEDATRYMAAYAHSIKALTPLCTRPAVRDNPGISVKLSAIHPRYEFAKHTRVMAELVPRALELALMARDANMGFNIDAEEADRLDLSLDIIAAVLADERLSGWDGFGVVVQAYGLRAGRVIDWLDALATRLDRRIMVRLVKGAYWDSEIKRAQVAGLKGFPVFTRKAATDVSYIANARRLFAARERIYPQFATHNAHTAAAIIHLAKAMGVGANEYEFQRLHGMGERLHQILMKTPQTRCRIYAPVGKHADLLAYLVRRLLENGANGSFVNMIADRNVPASMVARDPFDAVTGANAELDNPAVRHPADLFRPGRVNSLGFDLTDPLVMAELYAERSRFNAHKWTYGPIIAGAVKPGGQAVEVLEPASRHVIVGTITNAGSEDIATALAAAKTVQPQWAGLAPKARADLLRKTADLYEANAVELFALAAREAGKTLPDAVGEVREAVDFLRYYADEAEKLGIDRIALGTFACISPWNFPLAIFTGQVAAALVAGNAVVAKPAPQTPLIAARAVLLMQEAGIPPAIVQLLPGGGSDVGAALVSHPELAGVCFTGSMPTAKHIDRSMARSMHPNAPLIAETGGLNAMIVDSTALPEQAVRDIVSSAFQSAGQRCSALRILFVQEEAEARVLDMLYGAMDELVLGDPWDIATDIGPVIDEQALDKIEAHINAHADRVGKCIPVPSEGLFAAPTVIKVSGLDDLKEEIFGPVLHVATFKASEIDDVVDAINASGYGLTFGLHTRIDSRVERITERIHVGNIYVNRNQIGAVVGSQPFGGEGLSGTGPKAGGPHYLQRFSRAASAEVPGASNTLPAVGIATVISAVEKLRAAFEREALVKAAKHAGESVVLPGPTGESNTLTLHPRGIVLCLGPDAPSARKQVAMAHVHGNAALVIAPGATALAGLFAEQGMVIAGIYGRLPAAAIEAGLDVDAIACFGDEDTMRSLRLAVAGRDGAILPIIADEWDGARLAIERHVCIDTTASGGNAQLLATASAQ